MLNELEEERRNDNNDEESSVTRVTIRIYEVFLSFFESFFLFVSTSFFSFSSYFSIQQIESRGVFFYD